MRTHQATYETTMKASFLAYIVQGIVNNFTPLLFIAFNQHYGIPLEQITLLITVNFTLQLIMDIGSTAFVTRIGYRASLLLANNMAAIGMVLLAILPNFLSNTYLGILIASCFYSIGGGLNEVIVSPLVEATPSKNKKQAMSLLHSFYCWGYVCWGYVGVVLLSTFFMAVFGTEFWPILAILWSLVPLVNAYLFTFVPIAPLIPEGERGLSFKELLSRNMFYILFIMMFAAGASEIAVAQWASLFAEKGLDISKTLGDLCGPMIFALFMGTSRLLYGKYGNKIDFDKYMLASASLCILSYLLIGLVPHPLVGLLGCALCGFSVGIFWSGTYSTSASVISNGGTLRLLALAGDIDGFMTAKMGGVCASDFFVPSSFQLLS